MGAGHSRAHGVTINNERLKTMYEFVEFVEEKVKSWTANDGGLTNAACDTIAAAAWFCRNEAKPEREHYFSKDFGVSTASRYFDEFSNLNKESDGYTHS